MMNYPKINPCPVCHVSSGQPCVYHDSTEVRDSPHVERMPEWWSSDWSAGYEAALRDIYGERPQQSTTPAPTGPEEGR